MVVPFEGVGLPGHLMQVFLGNVSRVLKIGLQRLTNLICLELLQFSKLLVASRMTTSLMSH